MRSAWMWRFQHWLAEGGLALCWLELHGWGTSPVPMGISHKSYLNWRINYPIGSMYGIYGNMDPINIPPMLAYIPAPWILWVLTYDSFWLYSTFLLGPICFWAHIFLGSPGHQRSRAPNVHVPLSDRRSHGMPSCWGRDLGRGRSCWLPENLDVKKW